MVGMKIHVYCTLYCVHRYNDSRSTTEIVSGNDLLRHSIILLFEIVPGTLVLK